MEKEYVYYIYKTTCTITNKYYIGMHKTCNLKDGYMGSGLLLRRSIKKHGLNNHFIEILEYCDSYEKLAEREQYIVNSDLLNDPLCMNLKTGGIGGATMTGRKQSKETIEKRVVKLRGKKRSEEYCKANAERMRIIWKGNQYAKGNKHWVGKKHKKESIEKMRDNHPFVKQVGMYDLENNFIKSFNSLREAEKETGILRKHISRCCRGLAKTAGKKIWKFKTYEQTTS